MGGDIDPGDDHSIGGPDFIILREGSVDVLGCSGQYIRTGVLAEVNLSHTITCVKVSEQSCNRAELWRHFVKIRRLACWLCCGNKTIGVDLKSKARVGNGVTKKLDACYTIWLFLFFIF